MNKTDVQIILNRIKINPAFKYCVEYSVEGDEISVTIKTTHVETGKDTAILMYKNIDLLTCTEQDIVNAAYGILREVVLHEISECFMYKNSHVVEPHPQINYPTTGWPEYYKLEGNNAG